MIIAKTDTTGRNPYRDLAVGIVFLAVVLSSLFPFVERSLPLARSVHAQESTPVIHSVDPEPPYCVLRNSEIDAHRILTITAENLQSVEGKRLRFLMIYVIGGSVIVEQELDWLIGQEADWESADRIAVDISHLDDLLPSLDKIAMRVQITDEQGEGLSGWSSQFDVASDEVACGVSMPAQTPTSEPGAMRFPPTPPTRGIPGDLWADVILGKPDFTQIAINEVVPHKVFNPGGVLVDRSAEPQRAYVWDAGNSRILGINLDTCYEESGPCIAEIVIGQPSGYDHAACNGDSGVQNYPVRASASAETLCGIPDTALSPWEEHTYVTMAVSPEGDLFVPDSHNNRVLRYEDPYETDQVADEVWGQTDFSGIVCNQGMSAPTNETLCFHSHSNRLMLNRYGNGVELDSDGNLWVVDGGNNRVLRFPFDPASGEIEKAADLVLGQPNFHVASPGDTLYKFHAPSAVQFDSAGVLYVADTFNNRILYFTPPFRSGMGADGTFGSRFHRPTSLELDPNGHGLWVNDSGNFMIELWSLATTTVTRVLGKDSYRPDRQCGEPFATLSGNINLCDGVGGIGLDSEGNLLVALTQYGQDVIRFPDPAADEDSTLANQPDMRMFDSGGEFNRFSSKVIRSTRGVATWGDQLIVSDMWRLLFWNGLDSFSNGQPPDGIVGAESFVPGPIRCCGKIKADTSGRLWVLGFEGLDFIDVYQLPLTERSVPIHTIRTHAASFPVLGSRNRVSIGRRIFGIAPVGYSEFLWLSDTDNHRVLRIRDPLTNPTVDVILGQLSSTGTECNRGEFAPVYSEDFERSPHADMLCHPGALSLDRFGNLFVADHSLEVSGNFRLLMFSTELTPTNNERVILAPSASQEIIKHGERGQNLGLRSHWFGQIIDTTRHGPHWVAAWEPAFDSSNRMVVGFNSYVGGRFVAYYDDPHAQNARPTGYLYDFASMPYAATFDYNNNLYVGDINRSRVLVYLNPFNHPPREPQQMTTATSTATTTLAIDTPSPRYQVTITTASPEPPACLIMNSDDGYQRILTLMGENFPTELGSGSLQFLWVETGALSNNFGHDLFGRTETRMFLDVRDYRDFLWESDTKMTLAVRFVQHTSSKPLSNWSPAFLLVWDASSC